MARLFLITIIITFSIATNGQSLPDEIIKTFFNDYTKI